MIRKIWIKIKWKKKQKYVAPKIGFKTKKVVRDGRVIEIPDFHQIKKKYPKGSIAREYMEMAIEEDDFWETLIDVCEAQQYPDAINKYTEQLDYLDRLLKKAVKKG